MLTTMSSDSSLRLKMGRFSTESGAEQLVAVALMPLIFVDVVVGCVLFVELVSITYRVTRRP